MTTPNTTFHQGPRGSGKTPAIIDAVADTAQSRPDPGSYTIVVPSHRHAEAVKQELLQSAGLDFPQISTIDELALRIIHQARNGGDLTAPLSFWTTRDVRLHIDFINETHLAGETLNHTESQALAAWHLQNLSHHFDDPIPADDPRWQQIASTIAHHRETLDAAPMAALPLHCAQLLHENPALREQLARRHLHFLAVDDAHLLSRSQIHLVHTLAQSARHVHISLDPNHQDTAGNLSAADITPPLQPASLLNHPHDRIRNPRILHAVAELADDTPPNQPVDPDLHPDIALVVTTDTAAADLNLVESLRKQDATCDTGIVAPTAAVAGRISNLLLQHDILHEDTASAPPLFPASDRILSNLALLLNPRDLVAFRRAAQSPAGPLQARIAADVLTIAQHNSSDLIAAAESLLPHANTSSIIHQQLNLLCRIHRATMPMVESQQPLPDIVASIFADLSINGDFEGRTSPDLSILLDAARRFRPHPGQNRRHDLAAFLHHAAQPQEEPYRPLPTRRIGQPPITIVPAERAHLHAFSSLHVVDCVDIHYPNLQPDDSHLQHRLALQTFRHILLAATRELRIYAPQHDRRGNSMRHSRFLDPIAKHAAVTRI